jgi:hypothetical protein
MRLLTGLAFAVAAAAVAAAPGLAGPRASSPMVACGGAQVTFLFWPQGHQAIPNFKFPAYPLPHTEIYRTDPTYPNTAFLGFFDAAAQVSVASSCSPAPGVGSTAVSNAATITTTSAVNCTFPQPARFEILGTALLRVVVPVQKKVKVKVRVKKKLRTKIVTRTTLATVLTDQLSPSGSTLTYDSKLCVPAAAPA